MIKWIKRELAVFTPRRLSHKDSERELSRLLVEYNPLDEGYVQQSLKILSRIEQKSSALLTHISMMVACIGILIGTYAEFWWEKLILSVELVGYLFIAIACIRCLLHVDRVDIERENIKRDDLKEIYISEVHYREKIFRMSFKWLIILTCFFAVTIVMHIVAMDYTETSSS